MTLGYDLPVCRPSFVQRLDPRWKLAAFLTGAVLVALVRTLGPALAASAGVLILIGISGVPWGWCVRRLLTAMAMYALFLIWLPLAPQPGDMIWEVGVVAISQSGLVRLVVLTAKLAALIAAALVLLATTPIYDLFKATRALGLPRLFVLLLLLTTRYVFLLMEEFGRLRTALRVRGFRNRADLHSYRTIGQVAGTLLVRSHERSERVGHAMRCRGFDGEYRSLHEFQSTWRDVAAYLAVASSTVGLVVWDWLNRF